MRPSSLQIIRPYQPKDADALAQIFFDAVRIGAAQKYTQAQLEAWAPLRPTAAIWTARLHGLTTFVAADPKPLGFMSLRPDGYLDLVFVAPDQRGRGIGKSLHDALIIHARAQGLTRLDVEASCAAHNFFTRLGWQTLAAQVIHRHGQPIENFKMQFNLKQ